MECSKTDLKQLDFRGQGVTSPQLLDLNS